MLSPGHRTLYIGVHVPLGRRSHRRHRHHGHRHRKRSKERDSSADDGRESPSHSRSSHKLNRTPASFNWLTLNLSSTSFFKSFLLHASSLSASFLYRHLSAACPVCCSRHTSSEGAVSVGDRGWRRGTHPPRLVHWAGRNLPQGGWGRRMERDSQVRRCSRPHGLGLASCDSFLCCTWAFDPVCVWLQAFITEAVAMVTYLSGFNTSFHTVHCLTS